MAEACKALALNPVLTLAAEAGELSGVFRTLAWAALNPTDAGLIPDTPARKAHKKLMRQLRQTALLAGSAVALAGVAWWMYSLPRAPKSEEVLPSLESSWARATSLPPPLPQSASTPTPAPSTSSPSLLPPSASEVLTGVTATQGKVEGMNVAAWGGGGGRGWYSSPVEPVHTAWKVVGQYLGQLVGTGSRGDVCACPSERGPSL